MPDPLKHMPGLAPVREIHRADSGARRSAVLVFLACTLGGAAMLTALPAIERWLTSGPSGQKQDLAIALVSIALLLCLPLLVFAVRVWVRGAKVRRQLCYPLDADRVIRDTPVLRGRDALLRAWILQGLAIALAASSLLLAAAMWRFANLFVAS
jgi:hypothetical protein